LTEIRQSHLSVAVVGDLSKIKAPAATKTPAPAATTKPASAKPIEYPKMARLLAAVKPVVAKPSPLDYASAVIKNGTQQVQVKGQPQKEQTQCQSKASKRRQRAKKTKALKRAQTFPDKENQPSPQQPPQQQCSKFSSAESRLDTMVSELDLLLGM
jgi:hypothetical protein